METPPLKPLKQIITIAGRPGSGKSTAAKAVAAELGYQHFSSGDLFRAIAKEKGVDVLQANLSAEKNAEIDHLVDGRLQNLSATEDQLVVDSRMAWHWMPLSFKVFLNLDLVVAAKRILAKADGSRLTSEQLHEDPIQYARFLEDRLASETRRYQALYNVNPYDMANYDLVIDTKTKSADQVCGLIVEHFRQSRH